MAEASWKCYVLDPPGSSGAGEMLMHKFARNMHLAIINTASQFVQESSSIGTYYSNGAFEPVGCDYVFEYIGVQIIGNSTCVDKAFMRHAKADDHVPLRFNAT